MQEILASSAAHIDDPAIPTSFLSVITSDEDTFI